MSFLPTKRATYMYSLVPDEALTRTKEGVVCEQDKKLKTLYKKALDESGSAAYSEFIVSMDVLMRALDKESLWTSCFIDVWNVGNAIKYGGDLNKIFAG